MAYIHPEGRDLAIWVSVFTFLVLVVTALRLYTILIITKRKFRSDDYLVLVSVVSMIANEAIVFWEICNGAGEHAETLLQIGGWDMIAVHIKAMVGFSFTWTIATGFCKLTVLALYVQVFGANRVFRIFCYFMIFCICAWMISFIVVFSTHCDKIWHFWDPVLQATKCRPTLKEEYASVVSNLVLDCIIVTIPLPVIWRLQMPLRKKFTVTAMFGLGLIVISSMVWRLVTITINTRDHTPDLPHDVVLLLLQSSLEIWLGIIAAHLPSLAPLLDQVVRSAAVKYISSKFSRASTSHEESSNSVVLVTIGGSGQKKWKNFQRVEDDDEALFRHT